MQNNDSFTNTKPSVISRWTVPTLLLGAATLFPTLAQGQSLIYSLDGESAGSFFAIFATGSGDVNGDGYDDIVAGAGFWTNPNDPNGGSSHGRGYVYSGKDGTQLFTFDAENSGDQFGFVASSAGDVNQDGYDDMVFGATGWDDPNDPNGGSRHGRGYVYSGKDGTQLWVFNGENAGDKFGQPVGRAGDVNQDGYADLLVGAHGWDDPNDPNSFGGHGRAYVYSGKDGAQLFSFDGENAADGFGFSSGAAGDVNQDGYADVVVGALFWDDPNDPNLTINSDHGRAYVISGQDGSTLFTFEGKNAGDEVGNGASVNGTGDVNQDGYDDVIVAAPFWNDPNDPNAGTEHGRAYLLSGQDGTALFTFNGENVGDNFGTSVSSAGDVNQDGYPDMLVGAQGWDDLNDPNAGTNHGRAYVISGQDGTSLFTVDGENAGDRLGGSASSGDINGDGVPDLVIGAWNWGSGTGRAYVVSGQKLSLSTDEHLISVAAGGVSNLNLCVPAHANEQYLLLGSLSLGSTVIGSGTPTSGATMPIVNDIWTSITWVFRNGPVFINTQGSLDASGLATATINWPAGLVVLGGDVTTYYAALIYGANDCGAGCDLYYDTTNPVPVTFTP